jgi:hypothetical protein
MKRKTERERLEANLAYFKALLKQRREEGDAEAVAACRVTIDHLVKELRK